MIVNNISIIGEQLNMFINVTKIYNKLGCECVTINGECKNITGLTVICDQNTLHLSVNTIDINRKLDSNRNLVFMR